MELLWEDTLSDTRASKLFKLAGLITLLRKLASSDRFNPFQIHQTILDFLHKSQKGEALAEKNLDFIGNLPVTMLWCYANTLTGMTRLKLSVTL